MKRLLNPSTNAPGYAAVLSAAYAVVQAFYGHTVADPRVWLPAVFAAVSLLIRQAVTPVADPKVPGSLVTPLEPPKPPPATTTGATP